MSRKDPESFPKSSQAFQLGTFRFLVGSRELLDAAGAVVYLRSQTAEVLACLLGQAGAVVSKADLFEEVWAGSTVTDDSLVQCISEIRRALGDREHAIIQTIAKRGYKANATPVPVAGSEPKDPDGAQPSIAVLAFEDYSAGVDQNYLSDAIAEGIIAGLSRFSELLVIARNSSFSFRDVPTNVEDIARKLGVRYVLEGSQQKSGDRLRITVQLIDAAKGHHLWAEVYEDGLNDLFKVQDDIVRRVVASVAQKVFKHEARPNARSAKAKRTALLHHLEGRQHFLKFTPEGNELARLANEAAIEADETQPYGYVGLAFVYINGYRWGWTELGRDSALDRARDAARKAIELDPDYYDGHAAMAYVHLQDNNLDQAIARARRALDLNPNDTFAMADLAEFLGYAGQADEAETLLDKVARLDPLHLDWVRWNRAWVQWLNGKPDLALETITSMTETPPMANRVLAIIHMSLGQVEQAQAAVRALLDFAPEYSMADVRRNYVGKFRNTSDLDRVLTFLRQAGIPE